jgi:hypothetical protein
VHEQEDRRLDGVGLERQARSTLAIITVTGSPPWMAPSQPIKDKAGEPIVKHLAECDKDRALGTCKELFINVVELPHQPTRRGLARVARTRSRPGSTLTAP